MTASSVNPPPWPIPPSWLVKLPATARTQAADTTRRTIAVLVPGRSATANVADTSPAVVTVHPVPDAGPSFSGMLALTQAVGAAAGEGAHGVVVLAHDMGTIPETAWALELAHEGTAPVVLAAPADLADAVTVAVGAPRGLGCVAVSRGEIHSARHVAIVRAGEAPHLASPSAGPLGHVTDGAPRLLWRPPARFTVAGPYAGRPLRVGLHTVTLGDDGELLRAVAALCDGMVVAADTALADAPEPLAATLDEIAARIPLIVSGGRSGDLPATCLAPAKARVLMHLLLDAGRDHAEVLAAFAALERGETGRF